MIGIYKITSPSGKIYIGKSVDIGKRFKAYKYGHCKSQTKLYRSLVKYGCDNHKFDIIEECLESIIDEREIFWIEFFDCFNSKYGLNLQAGGQGGRASDETRLKIKLWNTGRKHTEETKIKISQSRIGNKYCLGRKLSQETRDKISKGNKGKNLGIKRSPETLLKASLSLKGKNTWKKGTFDSEETKERKRESSKASKPVIDLRDNKKYRSLKECCEKIGLSYTNVKNNLNGYSKINKFDYIKRI